MKSKVKIIVLILTLFMLIFVLVGCDNGDSSKDKTYTLTIDKIGEGTVKKSPDKAEYAKGEVVTLTVEPDENWDFAYWQGSGFDNNREMEIKVTMSDDVTMQAIFGKLLLIKDEFNDNSLKWPISPEGEFIREFTNDNKYSMTLKNEFSWMASDPARVIANDLKAQVDLEFATDLSCFAGFLFNFEDLDNYYMLRIQNSNGAYCIDREIDGNYMMVTDWEYTTIQSINKLVVIKEGNTYTFFLNGDKLVDITTERNIPYIGLMAGTYDEAPVTVLFDNYEALCLDLSHVATTTSSTCNIINLNNPECQEQSINMIKTKK